MVGRSNKRPASSNGPSGGGTKKPRMGASIISVGGRASRAAVSIKDDPDGTSGGVDLQKLKDDFIKILKEDEYSGAMGVSNSTLKTKFGPKYQQLVPIINELASASRLNFSKVGDEMCYTLVSDSLATKFHGLDVQARMVYQVIEESANQGIWTKDIKTKTNIQQQALKKIFKALEDRQLIKPFYPVTAKNKKRYMVYDLTPAKELTGGPWYTELEFDHEFISVLRTFLMNCIMRLNGGKGVTLAEIKEKMDQANVSRVQLALEEVQQLMQTLAFDYKIEQNGMNAQGEALFIAARRVSSMCDFKWWDALSPDFHFRTVRFEDGVTLSAHEPHHHTS
mmetsp:Transcript_26918/g.41227  ORF Transcript_26918/g.41227 Transcript_26918/m.41227 type:complete len:337 (-) Transcript_26918:107-1117(-)|eukprot:CAMPEP_0195299094 /NCGR_PEP_ID=MMETSP0707-20130614/24839_1 /TAXON_ID=33640 /ORGANISM="Asterionellopsis glacialis, Strain CCMP134" /LENGTH=336 /DNA_ID=CAMNT_0040361379 /DNA_START=268 /DNA_END=1278 /DNA_ORIENTATION=+